MTLPHSPAELPILFAHRGGRALGADNSLATFELSLATGIAGLESDLRLTADGVAILTHHVSLWHRWSRRKVAARPQAQLPANLLQLSEFYRRLGCDFELSLDVKPASRKAASDHVYATRSAEAAHRCASEIEQQLGRPAVPRLWLCHHDWKLLASWRERWPQVKLVNSTASKQLKHGLERRSAQLADAGIDALNLPQQDWSKGSVALAHRFELLAFGWGAHLERVIAELLSYGIDGIYGDNPNKLLAARQAAIQTGAAKPDSPTASG